jgi:nucleotide-binding universal stress UspA family protein
MMRTINTILVPLDLTEHAANIADWAIEWAERTRARLVLLHVLVPVHIYASPVFVDPSGYDEVYAQVRKRAEERLRPIAEQARLCGVETSVHVRVGTPAEEILSMARDFGAGLIVVGTHGRKGLAHVVLGSTAEKVVRLASCPVFVVKESHAPAGVKAAASCDVGG